jgi:hypothetical protein
MVRAARPGPRLRQRRVPGPPSQRSRPSYRQRGPRPGGLVRTSVLPSRRLATCGTTTTDVRPGCPAAGTPMRGVTPTGVDGAFGRFSRRHQSAIKSPAGITDQAGERTPARRRQHPTRRRVRAVAFHGSGRHLRQPSGSCRHQPGGHRCPLPSGRCSPTGPGRSGLSCAPCPHRPGLSPLRLSGHCLSRHCLSRHCLSRHCLSRHCLSRHCLSRRSLSAPSLRPPSLSQRRTGQAGPSHHTQPQPHRRSPLLTPGHTALRIFRWRISTGCARR